LPSASKKEKKVAQEFLSGMRSDVELIFIDESGFQQTLILLYGYSKVGAKCMVNSRTRSDN